MRQLIRHCVFGATTKPWGIQSIQWVSVVTVDPWFNPMKEVALFSPLHPLCLFRLLLKTHYFVVLATECDAKGKKAICQHFPTHPLPLPSSYNFPGEAVTHGAHHLLTSRSCSGYRSCEEAVNLVEWVVCEPHLEFTAEILEIFGETLEKDGVPKLTTGGNETHKFSFLWLICKYNGGNDFFLTNKG